jgi:hypothetical protein
MGLKGSKLGGDAGNLIAKLRGALVIFRRDGSSHFLLRFEEAMAELPEGNRSSGCPADVLGLMLHLRKKATEGHPEDLPAGRAAQAAAPAKLDVGEPTFGASDGWSRCRGIDRIGEFKDRYIPGPALGGTSLAKIHLRHLTLDDLGQVDGRDGVADGALERVGHRKTSKTREPQLARASGGGFDFTAP